MIRSASPQSLPAVIVAWFWSFGTYGRTDGQFVWKQWSLPAGTVVGLVDPYLSKQLSHVKYKLICRFWTWWKRSLKNKVSCNCIRTATSPWLPPTLDSTPATSPPAPPPRRSGQLKTTFVSTATIAPTWITRIRPSWCQAILHSYPRAPDTTFFRDQVSNNRWDWI